ncbi:hypothetical protein SAMN04515667_2308 [Formosa sp. Hel1_31_208]|uniref:hypothetical protein n=1 Tax=Formosa sp. Hel1_31_208 TaxID=1798225 RepID=UPI00087BB753|nr:hypothetical protein [Formosa sp. Hel1_31_208]SDS49712.1 hypothetical protein SAMN04515667_2308 [Formosa sp. Hel1_31_208]
MNKIGLEYGKWLAPMGWDYIATIRRHYPLTETNAPVLMQRAVNKAKVTRLFYSIEPDYNDKHTHAHLLLSCNYKLDRDSMAKAMNIQPQSISYFEPVINQEAVTNYCTKYVGRSNVFYNLIF